MLKAIPAFGALAAAAALVVPTVSHAAEASSVRVSYADLNLGSDEGANALQRRISYAARVACQFEDSRQIDIATATKLCRNVAISDARPAYEAAVAAARHGTVIVGGAAALIVTAR
jgi:UrcA family protein